MLQRITTGAILLTILVAVLALGGWVFSLVAMVAFGIALKEEYQALAAANHRPVQWPVWLGLVAGVPLVTLLSARAIAPIILFECLTILAIVVFRQKPSLEDALLSLMPVAFVLLPGLCIVHIAQMQPRALQLTFLSLVFVVSVLGDTLAYFVGSRVGGPKLCPQVSPKKTISGAIGGLVGSVLGALIVGAVAALCASESRSLLPGLLGYLGMGLVGGIAGQLGDLFCSLVKRHCGVKDFSSIFPGHGGMLDRLDSVSFTAVVIFCYQLIFIL